MPTTGAIASGEARVASAYTHVNELRSDMKSESKQLTVSISPTSFNSTITWGLSYVYAQTREQYRGFTSTTGNPLDVAWGRSGFDSRHQFQYRLTYNAFDWVRIGWNGSFRTGTPYTPTVTGDINGDGYSNDRAFVFDPADDRGHGTRQRHALAARQWIGLGARLPQEPARPARGSK